VNWQEQLRSEGYAILPGLIPPPLVSAALAAVALDLQTNYISECQSEYDNQSYCTDLRGTPSIMDLLVNSAVCKILDDALGIDQIDWDGGQIAIRKAHNHHSPIPPEPHIDGFSSGLNGLEPRQSLQPYFVGGRVPHASSQRFRWKLHGMASVSLSLRKLFSGTRSPGTDRTEAETAHWMSCPAEMRSR
jgi:hypothetical protein